MSSFIDPSAITEDVQLGEGSRIYKNAVVRKVKTGRDSVVGDFGRIENTILGNHVDLQRFSMIYHCEMGDYTYVGRNFTAWHAIIGKFCSISWNVSIGGANHDYHRLTQHAFLYAPQFGLMPDEQTPGYNRFASDCRVGNDVWIGCNAVICRGVSIGDGAVIGAGSVVTKDVEPYTIVGGAPARVIRRRCPMPLAERLIATKWWDMDGDWIRAHFNLFNSEITEETVEILERLVQP